MANLESKLLDGKCVGYCSSSEEENDSWKVANDDDQHKANVMHQMRGVGNTGPKGVLNDFAAFREQTKLERESRDKQLLKQAQRGMLQGKSSSNASNEQDDHESLETLRNKRLNELKKIAVGRMVEVYDKGQYNTVIDGSGDCLICVLIYEPGLEFCERLSDVCKVLAADYPAVKFVRARSILLELSKNFTDQALPTLQFYFNGRLVETFVRMTSILGHDYDAVTLKKFLRRKHISLDLGKYTTDSEYSTDEDID